MAPVMFIVDGTCQECVVENGKEVGQLIETVRLLYLFCLDKIISDEIAFYQVL